MATTTYNLQCIQSVAISESFPDLTGLIEANEYLISNVEGARRPVLLGFGSFPSSLRYKKIIQAHVGVYLKETSASNITLAWMYTPPQGFPGFNWATTSWNTAHAYGSWDLHGYTEVRGTTYTLYDVPINYQTSETTARISKETVNALRSSAVMLRSSSNSYYLNIAQSAVLTVEYDTATVPTQIKATSFTSGYLNPYKSNTFTWGFDWAPTDDYSAVGPIAQKSYIFSWRSSPSGSWNSTAVTSSTQSITIPAETFPTGTIYWKVSGTDGANQSSETPVYTISTTDSSTSATPVSPVSEVVDGSAPVVFTWRTSNNHGTTPTGADLQYSQDGAAWTDLAHVSGSSKRYTMAVGTLNPGRYYWRVRAYNADGNAGPWSSSVSIILVAAPVVTGLYATSVPFSTISWQASGQQSYKITLDGKLLGTFFGDSKSYILQDYLEDGEHTVTVEVENDIGLWSEPADYTFTIENIPGDSVYLAVAFAVDADLTWTTDSANPDFQVYRDETKIGNVSGISFRDRFALGDHSYFVINLLPGGYYTKSNIVSGRMKTCVTLIDTLDPARGWLEMKLTANDPDEQVFSYQRTASLRHFTGAVYPVLELSKYEDGSGTYDVAFSDPQAALAFEDLKGKVVIIKSRGGNVMVGALLTLQKRVGDFFTIFEFTVQRIHWEDFVDGTDS